MAIAASFLISPKIGFSTAVAVFFHEIPHEIGDYAILIQSGSNCTKVNTNFTIGFSQKKAMLVQFWTAFGALAGCLVGLAAGGYIQSVNWILPFTAGGFIYIAIADVIPELLENSSFKQTLRELFGICFGIFMMYLIAIYE
jgi:zinc transporter 7